MAKPHVHVVVAADQIPSAVQSALQELRVSTSFWPFSAALNDGLRAGGDAVIVVACAQAPDIVARLEVLFDRLAERPRPTLLVAVGGALARRPAHPALLPLVYAIDPPAADLAARLTTLLELRGSFAALTAVGDEVRVQHEQLQTRYRDQLRVASLVQRELNAPALARLGPVSFHTLVRQLDTVSGDVLEFAQIDDHNVGFFIADASGHGLPAAMLTMFVKRAFQTNANRNPAGGPSPAAVLQRLNEDLCRSNLSECPFVAALCGVVNVDSLELRFARAGAPYPLLRTAGGSVSLQQTQGSVLGVLPRAEFELETLHLSPGEAFLIYSDGLDRVMRPHLAAERLAFAFRHAAAFEHSGGPQWPAGEAESDDGDRAYAAEAFAATATTASATAFRPGSLAKGSTPYPAPRSTPDLAMPDLAMPDLAIASTAWFEWFASEGAAAAVEQARMRFDSLRRMGEQLDDVTVLALEVDA